MALSLGMLLAAVSLPLASRRQGRASTVALIAFTGVAANLVVGQVNALFALAFGLALLACPLGGPLLVGLCWVFSGSSPSTRCSSQWCSCSRGDGGSWRG